MHLLHLDSSATGASSVTRTLSAAVVAHVRTEVPGLQVTTRDLDATPLPHLTARTLAGEDAALGQRVLQEFMDADVIVIGAPMYNFGIPSTLKAWIDRIAVAGTTFRYGPNGPEGLAGGKTVVIASGRGGVHDGSPLDFQEPYLHGVLGFLGITDVRFVRAEGVSMSPAHRESALAAALADIDALEVRVPLAA